MIAWPTTAASSSREISPLTQMLADREREALVRLASRAWTLAEAGLADLVQVRHGEEDYSYYIVARRRPRRAQPAMLLFHLAEAA
ncbi:hypothetical protein M0638_22970 [Roseomonas sp. NAR14]|uniref:Uncharacterized protein n=1 Tax=Roseomonas acroporae TaxID=2937791 RepID=A0A9X1YCJ2_9PROT|nr:hypothetical protein [Roseomonas acroporae]MCK8787240.1 hypothetical protein [Roseomonas acroporae]